MGENEQLSATFELLHADAASPVVISFPHSGTWIPADMRKHLLPMAVLANSDWFLPALYDFLPQTGFTTLINRVNRYVADPNRAVTLDSDHDYRSATIYQRNTFNHPLYARPLPPETLQSRLRTYYWPYRHALTTILKQKQAKSGHAYLIDLHSFAQYPHYPGVKPKTIVLGNDHDRTTSKVFRQTLSAAFAAHDFTVENNFPFRGGDITRYYGHQPNITAIQIELRYDQYIDQRPFREEVLTQYQTDLFRKAQDRLRFLRDFLLKLT
ncbi:N-formylglutamate amidohydrolase [Lacticaseibacillus paracasei]|uniref:N-formylglutamate amidohydrolase n=1 Tax=Lacticaseibacillus paracasei TaxID=1597 RepID=UPI0011580175|nr:N-formylglutamate amidohydrolase [Lacticaseibacillus paracasei]MCT3349423.1 N-formylglutamate amidohydrolase [Lacticaseibacillus paracasei]VTZ82939.1 hypothetical protein LPCP272_00888 [Lacticaseibacillus paracasei]